MTVAFSELAGSPVEKITQEGFRATRQILVAWADRDAMVRELLGDSAEFAAENASQYPGRKDVRVVSIGSVPWETKVPDDGTFTDITADLNGYAGQLAHMSIEYNWVPPTVWPDPTLEEETYEANTYIVYSRKLSGEYHTQTGMWVTWEDDHTMPVPKDVSPTIRVPITEHHYTWHRVTKPPHTAIAEAVGKVNAVEWNGYKKETLLFEGATMKREFRGFQENDAVTSINPEEGFWATWEVGYVFRERSIFWPTLDGQLVAGWNHTWRQTNFGGAYDKLVNLADGEAQYRSATAAEFSALFKNEAP